MTNIEIEPAHNSYGKALIPSIESTEEQSLKLKELIDNSLFYTRLGYNSKRVE
jgi:hypothetical protein